MPITFVTALIDLREERPGEKAVATYLSLLETLQAAGLRIHAFLSPSYAEKVTIRNGVSEIIDLATLETTTNAPQGLPDTRTETKDTRPYLCLMNAKIELVQRAIASGLHSSTHYAWIDAGISHILATPMETLQALAETPLRKEGLWIPGCPGHSFRGWDTICWRFCGGFFVGDPRTLNRFYTLAQRELPLLPKLSWEVNVWAYMEMKGAPITWYAADHNDSMLRPPRFEPILRKTDISFYWYGYLSGCRVGGCMEKFVESCLRDLGNPCQAVFSLSDGFQSYDEPAICKLESLSETSPILVTLCTRNYTRRNLLYLPLDDDTFERGLESVLSPFPRPSWESRQPMVYWRGVTSGAGRPPLRTKVIEMLFPYRHANVKAVPDTVRQDDPPRFMFEPARSSIQEHMNYKYILIVDGNVIASSHQWVFGSGSVPIMVSHPDNMYWFKKYLEPMVHYVPVRYDLSDLKDKIEWLIQNDDKAKEIAENALQLSQRIFCSEFQKQYVREEIERLATRKPTIGVAIPCYRPHMSLVSTCLDSIEAQTVKPEKVVISCSSTTTLPEIHRDYSFPFDIITIPETKLASQNRNIAASYLDTDIVSFFDVDDVMHPRRLETILSCFHSPCDIVLHSFVYGPTLDTSDPYTKIRRNVLQRAMSGCAIVVDNFRCRIHHAHVSVRKEICDRIPFREQPQYNRVEDSMFCGDVLSIPYIRSAYVETPLSAYIPSGNLSSNGVL